MLILGLVSLGGLTIGGYVTMLRLACYTVAELTPAQAALLDAAQWLTQTGTIMLGAFIFGWLDGQAR